jgi:GT2 family glycosyltransferase
MGGFDTIYRPAYCEDADLAFRLREAGYEVWLQPLSRVLHYEGQTHGTDLKKAIKSYQKLNMRRLAERWKAALVSRF